MYRFRASSNLHDTPLASKNALVRVRHQLVAPGSASEALREGFVYTNYAPYLHHQDLHCW